MYGPPHPKVVLIKKKKKRELLYKCEVKIKHRLWCLLSSVCPTALFLSAAAVQHAGRELFPGQGTLQSADTRASETQMPALLWKEPNTHYFELNNRAGPFQACFYLSSDIRRLTVLRHSSRAASASRISPSPENICLLFPLKCAPTVSLVEALPGELQQKG